MLTLVHAPAGVDRRAAIDASDHHCNSAQQQEAPIALVEAAQHESTSALTQ